MKHSLRNVAKGPNKEQVVETQAVSKAQLRQEPHIAHISIWIYLCFSSLIICNNLNVRVTGQITVSSQGWGTRRNKKHRLGMKGITGICLVHYRGHTRQERMKYKKSTETLEQDEP